MTGSLDDAAAIAAIARKKAEKEAHAVRLAHAAFQECLALLWAGRLDEVRECVERRLPEYARLAGNRWTAWALFVEAGWEVHSGRGENALKKYDDAELKFRAEGLLDGVVSVETARLAAYRLSGSTEYAGALAKVTAGDHDGAAGAKYYTKGNEFSVESILNDQAEHARCGRQDLNTAQAMYERTAASRYPLQSALGHLGLALIQAQRGQPPRDAAQALLVAESIGFRLVAARSRELLTQPPRADAVREVYFV
jgi:hypothetical protein